MESFYLIIPVAIIFCVVAIKAFFWAVDHRQFDDLESEGKRILFDDDDSLSPVSKPPSAESKSIRPTNALHADIKPND